MNVRKSSTLTAGGAVAIVVTASSLAGQLGSADAGQKQAAATVPSATESIAPTPTLIDRPDPTYTWSDTPPQVVLRTPDHDVPLRTWLGCWTGPSGDGNTP